MNPHYSLVAPRAGHPCEYCHAPESIFNFPFEVEHIMPEIHRGQDDEANLALACRSCNLSKSDCLTGWDETTSNEIRLFHPRLDSWTDHFAVHLVKGEIKGITSIGRATVARLRMNSAAQLDARRVWMQLGLFP